jgi:hypothetical protein
MDAASDVVRLNEANITVSYSNPPSPSPANWPCEGNNGTEPNSITVVASFRHPITFPFVADMIGHGSILLVGSSTATILQPVCE